MKMPILFRLTLFVCLASITISEQAFALDPDLTGYSTHNMVSNQVCYLPPSGEINRKSIIVGRIKRDGSIKIFGSLAQRLKKLRELIKQGKSKAKEQKAVLLSCLSLTNVEPDPKTIPPIPPPIVPSDPRCAMTGILPANSSAPEFYMQIESVLINGNALSITTSGAKYEISRFGVDMWRRVDPKTNGINQRKVSQLSFADEIGPLVVCSQNTKSLRVASDYLVFDIFADSFMVISALKPTKYAHYNLVVNAPWNKGSGLDRMWTDGYGGSLHARIAGHPLASVSYQDGTLFEVKSGDQTGHMVFPPRKFDFEGMYGANARPFVHFIGDDETLISLSDSAKLRSYAAEGFGTFALWATFYEDGTENPMIYSHSDIASYPIRSYDFSSQKQALLKRFIELAHLNGFKVITYLYSPATYQWNYPGGHPLAGQHQDISITLKWMRKFQTTFDLDGWYFDNANTGDMMSDYSFIRQVRSDIGISGIIYHHDSVDVWDTSTPYSGLRAIMVNAYVNYTLTGETGPIAEVHDPLDSYLRFYTAGYGLSQAYAAHKRTSLMRAAISDEELDRVLAQNLHGCQRNRSQTWLDYTKPFYDMHRSSYLAGHLHSDVLWPASLDPAWFLRPTDVRVERRSGTSVRISWKTPMLSDSAVTYTSNNVWWISYNGPSGPDGIEGNDTMSTDHSVTLSNLKPNTAYRFKIRSSNQAGATQEIIAGQMGEFLTDTADSDRDGLLDDWELQYFGNLSHFASNDSDHDGLFEIQEVALGTNPLLVDSDYDGINDGTEVGGLTNPLDWNDPPRSCNNDNICQSGTNGENSSNCPNDCKAGLLVDYRFEQPYAWDRSAFGHDGILNGVYWQNGSFYFPRSIGAYIELPTELSSLNTYLGPLGSSTITAWVKPLDVNRYNFVASNVAGLAYLSAGTDSAPGSVKAMVRGFDNTNSWPTSYATLAANAWTHIAFVLRGGIGSQIYINGVLDSDHPDPNVMLYSYGTDPSIGKSYATSHFNGSMSQFQVWQKALTAQEICLLTGKSWSGSTCN